jgi:chromosome segregation ATPase
MDGEHERKGL